MYLYVIDLLEPLEFSLLDATISVRALRALLSGYFLSQLSTQGALRAHSVISHVHSKLLTPLYSMQVAQFSAIFTIPKYPCSIPKHVMNNAIQF